MGIVKHAVWFIETHEAREIILPDVAAYCGVTSFHLARVFRATTGYTVMGYLRARRLSEAAKILANGDVDILTVALTAGYGSHEAFGRAFLEKFKQPPKAVRRNNAILELKLMEPYRMDESLIVELKPHRIESVEAFRVTGLSRRYAFETNSGIPALWMEFLERVGEINNLNNTVSYGVCSNSDAEGNFDYLVGVESDDVVDSFQSLVIPAGKYAVFTHSGHITEFRKTVYTIWNVGMDEAGLEYRAAPDFELYDARFNGKTGLGDVEIWMPVV